MKPPIFDRFRFAAGLSVIGLAFAAFFPSRRADAPSASPSATPARSVSEARAHFRQIEDYVVYYGTGALDQLARFDLAIVQPETLDADQIAALRAGGTLLLAYLSVGEAEPTRSWFAQVEPAWLLGQNPAWGSLYADARAPGWQHLMRAQMGTYLALGFDGVFLDTVDTVDVFPETAGGMIALIKGLRTAFPDAVLLQNRGLSILDSTAPVLDGLLFESYSTTYSFATRTYVAVDNAALATRLYRLQQRTGLPVLTLDYAPSDRPDMARLAVQLSRGMGFIPAVSVITLDAIPDYGLEGAADRVDQSP